MKRLLLITLGVIFILVLLGIWVYMLLTGSPENTDQFTKFTLGDTTDPTVVQPVETKKPLVDVASNKPLQQLTTKPVAGFTEIQSTASSSPHVYYVESGTGHIFSINLETGEENRLSATTVPLTTKAVITPDGLHVLLQSGARATTEFIIGTLASTSDTLGNFALTDTINTFTATADNELLYISPSGDSSVAKAYNPKTNTTRTLFTIPFRDVAVSWGNTAAGPHLVYPKASSRLLGFVYSYTNSTMSRLPISGYGLSVVGSPELSIYSYIMVEVGKYTTNSYIAASRGVGEIPVAIIPEKCAFNPNNTGEAICGTSPREYSSYMPDTWYRGEVTTTDALWTVRPEFASASLLEDISESSGQTIDIINPKFSPDGQRYYFQNKIDNTLWVYDFTK